MKEEKQGSVGRKQGEAGATCGDMVRRNSFDCVHRVHRVHIEIHVLEYKGGYVDNSSHELTT